MRFEGIEVSKHDPVLIQRPGEMKRGFLVHNRIFAICRDCNGTH